MKTFSRSVLTLVVVLTVVLAGMVVTGSAAPTTEADSTGEARTVVATPGPPAERTTERTTDVTGEIILEEGREMEPSTVVSGTITVVTHLPENAAEASGKSPEGRKIVREVGWKGDR